MILLAGVALVLAAVLCSLARDERTKLPRRWNVKLGQAGVGLGLLLVLRGLPTGLEPRAWMLAFAVALFGGLIVLRAVAGQALGWTALGEVVAAAVVMVLRRSWGLRLSLLATTTAALVGGAWLAARGVETAGLLSAALLLAPARAVLLRARRQERTRTAVERAMAGALTGGLSWENAVAALGGAPAAVRFDVDGEPVRVSAPLPPGFKASTIEALQAELDERLRAWGRPWAVRADTSRRTLVAERRDPLPERIDWKARPARGRTVTLGLARLDRAGEASGLGRFCDVVPLRWDLDRSPHGQIVGVTGGGKSVAIRLVITQWLMAGYEVILCDPKRVEFSPFARRRGVRTVATSLEDMTGALEAAEGELQHRFEALEATGLQHVKDLHKVGRTPPVPLLVVVDEAYELLSKTPGSDEIAKAENVLKARCGAAIRSIVALGRAVDVHACLLAQRMDAEVVKGSLQNNLPFKMLMEPATARSTERTMVDLAEVRVHSSAPGRAVARAIRFPECEVQVAYLDVDDLDRLLPRRGAETPALVQADDGPDAALVPQPPAQPSGPDERTPDRQQPPPTQQQQPGVSQKDDDDWAARLAAEINGLPVAEPDRPQRTGRTGQQQSGQDDDSQQDGQQSDRQQCSQQPEDQADDDQDQADVTQQQSGQLGQPDDGKSQQSGLADDASQQPDGQQQSGQLGQQDGQQSVGQHADDGQGRQSGTDRQQADEVDEMLRLFEDDGEDDGEDQPGR